MNHYAIDIVHGDTLEAALENMKSLAYETANGLFLPKKFRKMPQGPELEVALSNYVASLDKEIERLIVLRDKVPTIRPQGKIIIRPTVLH